MGGVIIEYDHVSLQGRHPETVREVEAVPRQGETVTVFGRSFIVWHVHWWEQPVEAGKPAARIVLRTAEERRRAVDRMEARRT